MSGNYEDMVALPHHVSRRHPRMPISERAAQFAPFAALTGYDSVIRETARLTDTAAELDDSEKMLLDLYLRELLDRAEEQRPVRILWFRPDGRKSGGAYVETVGIVQTADRQEGVIVLADGTRIPVEAVAEIEPL